MMLASDGNVCNLSSPSNSCFWWGIPGMPEHVLQCMYTAYCEVVGRRPASNFEF